ncbi:MAG TPA: hypothetical protein VK508_12635 [Cyclobacteriaceae bacterium]|nr:hypothetical protein [Cyclobacteriaceae bacterium]
MKSLIVAIAFLSCHASFGQTLREKAFTLGDEKDFIANSCELMPECDCCSAELVLLTTSTFAVVDRCVSGDTFYSGTYSIKDSILTLVFKQKVVNEEEDEGTNTTKQKLRPFTLKDQTFKIKPCGKSLILEGSGAFYKYGVGLDNAKEAELRQELGKSIAFKMLDK